MESAAEAGGGGWGWGGGGLERREGRVTLQKNVSVNFYSASKVENTVQI